MGRMKTHEEFVNEVFELVGNEYEVLDNYEGHKVRLRFKHNKCMRTYKSTPSIFLQGFMCVECSPKIEAMRLSIEVVKEKLKKINSDIKITSDEYTNNRTHLSCKCKKCGHEFESTWGSLKKGIGCQRCSNGNLTWTIESVKKHVRSVSDSKLLSDIYRGSNDNLEFRCNCGNVFNRTLQAFNRSEKTCAPCSYKRRGKLFRTPKNEIKETVESEGGTLDSTYIKYSETYINTTDKEGYKHSGSYSGFKEYGWGTVFGTKNKYFKENIKKYMKDMLPTYTLDDIFIKNKFVFVSVYCDKGHYYKTNLYSPMSGQRCGECESKSRMGVNHPRYNPLLTDEERAKSRYKLYGKYPRVWARNVHKKHNYKCVVCNSRKDLHAHHLEGWNIAKHMRFSVANGVTLCREHHTDFHKKYGYGDNTKIQFDEYLKTFAIEEVGKKESILM